MINQYRVFQIKEVHHQHWAKSYAQQVEDGFLIHHQNYQSAYKGKPAPSDTPMTARKRLEEKRPNTFIGRSFGVGDVIVWDEEKGRKFFYVDKEELVEFGGFMDADAAGNTVIYMVPNYQIDGKTGTWLPYDSEVVEGVCFFMMRNEQRKDADGLRLFTCQSTLVFVGRIEADEVVVRLDFVVILILVVLRIKHFALHIKKFRFTVYALQKNISTEYPVPVCIQQGSLQNFVMLIFQIVECSTIVCTFTRDVF